VLRGALCGVRVRAGQLSYLSEVTRVELIHQDSVVVLTSGKTTTTRVRPVLTDTTVTGGHVSSLLTVGVQSGRLFIWWVRKEERRGLEFDQAGCSAQESADRAGGAEGPSSYHDQRR
jgi:hypothetical protein